MNGYSKGDQLVIAGMTVMVDEEGLTPREALERVKKIQNDIFFALCQLEEELEEEYK